MAQLDAALDVLGEKVIVRARSKRPGIGPSVVEQISPPGMGPPLHRHSREDEVFYVAAGTVWIWRGNEQFDAGPGDVVIMPWGLTHTFQNVGETPSRLVVTLTPGGFERFFEEVAERGFRVPDDLDRLISLAGAYGVEILGPPPGASESGAA